MSLAHPALNHCKKSKSTKFKSAEHKKAYLAARAMEEAMIKQYGKVKTIQKKGDYQPNYNHRSSNVEITRPDMIPGNCTKKESPTYTGDLIKGIAVMHKSCLQPVINQEEMIASARMRR